MAVKMKTKTSRLLILTLFFLLSACFSDTKITKENIKTEIANENFSTAIISLKNLIQKDTKNPELRLLLGEAHLKQGNLLDAEKEYLKALDLGANINELILPYFEANYFLSNTQLIVNEWEEFKSNNQVIPTDKLITIIALAYLEENMAAQADLTITNFLKDNGEDKLSLSKATKNYIESGHFDIAYLTTAVNKWPKDNLPLFLLAKSYTQNEEFEEAAAAYTKLAKLQKNRDTIQLLVADSHIKAKQYDAAQSVISSLLKKYPNNDSVNLLQAYINLENKDYENAKKHADKAKISNNESIQAHMIAGVSSYYLKNYEMAFENLQFVENNIEQENPTKRILIATQLELGYSTETIANLSSLKNHSVIDSELIAKASFDLIQQGNNKDALALINSLPDEYITSVQAKQKFSLLKLALGDDTGFSELEVLAESNDDKSKIIYIASLIASNKSSEAKNTINEWVKTEKLSPTLKVLLAKAESELGFNQNAIALYKEVLKEEKTTNTLKVKLALAQEYITAKDYLSAEKLYDETISNEELNESAILGYIQTSLYTQSNKSALARIEKLLAGKETGNKLILAKAYIISGYPIKVINLITASEIKGSDTQKSEQWLMLGDSYLSIGLHKQANEAYSKLPSTIQNSESMEMRYFQLYEQSKDYKAALTLINKNLLKKPHTQYKLLQIHFQTLNNQPLLALNNIDSLSKKEKELPAIQGLMGRALLKNKQEIKALPLLKLTYDQGPSSINALTLFRAIYQVKGVNQAIAHLERHLAKFPADEASRMIYASLLDNKDEMIKQYKILAKSQVENFIVLNNLAWALYEQEKYQEAKIYADRAFKASPNHKSIINTLNKINDAIKASK